VTIDPDRSRTDLARGWWRQAGIAEERIQVVTAKALEAFAAREAALDGPFDLAQPIVNGKQKYMRIAIRRVRAGV